MAVLVFVSVRGLSLVAASGGHSSSRCAGLSLSRPLLLRSTGSRCAGSVIVAHGPSCSAVCGVFPDQGLNPCPLHWQADSQPLRHQGSPLVDFFIFSFHTNSLQFRVFYIYSTSQSIDTKFLLEILDLYLDFIKFIVGRADSHTEAILDILKSFSMTESVPKHHFSWDFLGGTVVKNPPANAGDTDSSPGPERSHTPQTS